MRKARVCYDHLAGDLSVRMFDSLVARKHLTFDAGKIELAPEGARFVGDMGIDLPKLRASRRPLCRCCLDWSERRDHLAGSLGAAFLDTMLAKGWARRDGGSRAVHFSPPGEIAFLKLFPLDNHHAR